MSGRNGNGHRPGVSLSKLLADNKTIQVPFGAEAVTITYRPQWFTALTESLLRDITDSEVKWNTAGPMAELVPQVITEWNLMDADGQPIPLKAESLRTIPLEILTTVIRAAQDDARPNSVSATS